MSERASPLPSRTPPTAVPDAIGPVARRSRRGARTGLGHLARAALAVLVAMACPPLAPTVVAATTQTAEPAPRSPSPLAPSRGQAQRTGPSTAINAAPRQPPVPKPQPAVRPSKPDGGIAATADRGKLIHAVTGFAYQLVGLDLEAAARSPYDMLIIDATTGRGGDGGFTKADVARLKKKPDGSRRLVLSYLSIGEAEDYRPDYFAQEYMTEDAPDWLMSENPQWKGNRIIRFCEEGWQRTVLGDDDGRSLYNSIEPSPLYRLVELGLDGVALDRVDVYNEVGKACPDARNRMIDFVARLAAHARKKNPRFLVLLHNAEELLTDKRMLATIDAAVKEDLFYGAKNTEALNSEGLIRSSLGFLARAKAAGRPVFVIDYLKDRARIADDRRRIEAQGFIPYFGPRKLDALWLPGQNF